MHYFFQVEVGNIKALIGYLNYEHNFWETEAFRWAIIGGLLGAIVLIMLCLAFCCYCCGRRKKAEKTKHLDMQLATKQNGFIAAYSDLGMYGSSIHAVVFS